MAKILWAKTNSRATIPTKRKEDGGLDIYGIIPAPYLILRPSEIHLFSTGLMSAFSHRYRVIFKERGSTGTQGLQQRAGVIDSGFRGEWLVPIQNSNDRPVVFYDDVRMNLSEVKQQLSMLRNPIYYPMSKAICQALMERSPRVNSVEVSKDKLLKKVSKRMFGKLGSSGK